MNDPMQASLSVLAMSMASSAAMALGLAPDPQSGKMTMDKTLAKFNIDLLVMLKEKTRGNTTDEEAQLITSLIGDLQNRFLQL